MDNDQGRIIFVNRVYPPDEGSTGQLLAELAEQLVCNGWIVTVIVSCSVPGTLKRECVNGVSIERIPCVSFSRSSHWRRAVSYLSLYPLFLAKLLSAPRPDVVVCMTDPPLHLIIGLIAKWFRCFRIIHWAQDIYPELAEELGVLAKNGFIGNLLRRISTYSLNKCNTILVLGTCMIQRLVNRGVMPNRIHILPNWANTALIYPIIPEKNKFRIENDLVGKQLVMYSGNMGMAHSFDVIIDAIALLEISMPHVLFLFIGDGKRKTSIQNEVGNRKLQNVRFFPLQRKSTLAHSLSAANLHIACMNEDLCGLVVPSKVYGILAAGRPCIFLGPKEGEVAKLIHNFGCGEVLPNATCKQLAQTIETWLGDEERLTKTELQARQIMENANIIHAAKTFSNLIKKD